MNAVIATADGIILLPESKYMRVHDYDPTKARVGQERWAAKTGGQIEAMAYSDLAVCVLSRSAIFLYNPVNGKKLRDKEIPVEASYKVVRYFGVVGQELLLVTDTCVMTVPLINTTSSFASTTALIDWAVPAGSGSDVLLFERNVGGANHNITYFKDGKGTIIFTTDELVVAAPIILHLEAEKKVVVMKEADHIVGVGLPAGKEVFRVGFKAVFGPVRIANRFFVGDDGGRVYQFAPGGTLTYTYRASVAAQVRDIDASTDGKIMVATVGRNTVTAFDLETHEKLYETPLHTPPHEYTLSRIYPSTKDDWTSHAGWHNGAMWFYSPDSAYFYPFDIKKGSFLALVCSYEITAESRMHAFATGTSRIIVQWRNSSYYNKYICSLSLDAANITEVCIDVGEQRLNSTEWNSKTGGVVIATSEGKVMDVKISNVAPIQVDPSEVDPILSGGQEEERHE